MIIRGRFYASLSDFERVAPGRYQVRRGGEVYRIEGGMKLGGSNQEWFLTGPAIEDHIRCVSLADGLRLLDGM